MNEPIVQANRNLVLNGDFTKGTTAWKKSGLVNVVQDNHEGFAVNILQLTDGGSVSQEICIPKAPGINAQYMLSFLWETQHAEPGWLSIFKGEQKLHEIELRPRGSRNLDHAGAQLATGQPLEFLPTPGELTLDHEKFGADDILRIEVRSPKNDPNDEYSKLRITDFKLHLHLEPLKLDSLKLDLNSLAPGSTVYLCLGASLGGAQGSNPLIVQHQLSFIPLKDHPWEGTRVALTSPGNPLGAVKAEPDWGVEQALTDTWRLDCPLIGEEKSYDFSINVNNHYTAEPYSIDVSLGHHRVVIEEVQEAAYYPVLEYGQSVRLGGQVRSYYTGQALDGRTVTWTLSGQGQLGIGTTNEQGWVYYDFTPTAAGDVVITASVDSPYDATGTVTREFAVKVLATDPWKDLRAVVEEQETPWDATGYPNRGSADVVQVRLPASSPLRGSDLALHWSGDDHGQLGVEVSPALEQWVPVGTDDMSWTLTSEDRLDGRFVLSLVCSKLLKASPGKPMALARNRTKIGEVREANRSPVVDERESVVLRIQALHDVPGGEAVIGAMVEWQTPNGVLYSRTGAGGWASGIYTPTNAGNQVVTASVRAHEHAVAVTRDFAVKAIATSAWKDQIRIRLNESELSTSGVACTRGSSNTLKVEALPGSSLIGKSIALDWRGSRPDIGLELSDPGVGRPLPAEGGLSWTLSSEVETSTSSLFEIRLICEGLEDRELVGRLWMSDIHPEATVVLDQMTTTEGEVLYPCLGATHRYTLRVNALSPLVGLPVTMEWAGTSPEDLGAKVDPAPGSQQLIGDGGASWTADFSSSAVPGTFQLSFNTPLGTTATNEMKLAHNKVRLEAASEPAVDPVVGEGQAPAWMWGRVWSAITGQPVAEFPVKWQVGNTESVTNTDHEGWSGFPFVPPTGGEHSVTALTVSLYDCYEDRVPMTVKALDQDPWSDLTIEFDDQPPQPWGVKTFFPRRKDQHRLTVKAPADSPLLNRQLTLGMTGTGPGELAIQFTPTVLGVPKLFSIAGYSYDFTVGDVANGSFAFCLASERLASLSPANAMSLGEGASVAKIAERQRVNQVLLWGAVVTEQVQVISTLSGKPMVGMTVTWRSADHVETSTTDFYGVAKVGFVPVTPGAFALTATVGDEQNPDSISLPFYLNEPRHIKELVSAPTGSTGQEMSAQAWVVSANTGEPLANVEVMWEYDNKALAPTLTDPDGRATVRFILGAPGKVALWATVKGGIAGWDAESVSLDILEANHAAVESVVASVNPVRVNTFVTMTAQIVDKVHRQPMAHRSILVSRNGAPVIDAKTDSSGRFLHHWMPLDTSEVVSLFVKIENSDGSSDGGGVYVTVVR